MPCQRWRSQATAVAGLIAGLAAPPAGSHTARHKLPSTTGCRKERTWSEARFGQACPGRTAPKGESRPRCQRTHGPTPLPWAAPSHCLWKGEAACPSPCGPPPRKREPLLAVEAWEPCGPPSGRCCSGPLWARHTDQRPLGGLAAARGPLGPSRRPASPGLDARDWAARAQLSPAPAPGARPARAPVLSHKRLRGAGGGRRTKQRGR